MDRFFDLFENVDLVNIDKILLTKNDKDKVYNLFKNLKESINLCQVADEVKNIKNRCRQTGGIMSGGMIRGVNRGRGRVARVRGRGRIIPNRIARDHDQVTRDANSRRGNRQMGRIVNDINVNKRRDIRNNVDRITPRAQLLVNPLVNLLNNQQRIDNQPIILNTLYFQIRQQRPGRINRRFNEQNTSFEIRFQNLPNDPHTLQDILYSAVEELLSISFQNVYNRFVRLAIYHDELETPIGLPYMRKDDLKPELVMAKFLLVVQSNRNLKIENGLIVSASRIDLVDGGSSSKRLKDFIYKKQSIIKITNSDFLCGLRAICVGIMHNAFIEDRGLKWQYKHCIRYGSKKQLTEAKKLAKQCQIPKNRKLSIDDLKRVETYLKIYQILIISADKQYDFVYVGPTQEKKIVLLHNEDHYDYIKSLPAFFNEKKFCFICLKPYSHDFYHKCIKICKLCQQKTCNQQISDGYYLLQTVRKSAAIKLV
jgi:hypothetical protein